MRLKGNAKKFCDDTTMHGFKELYYANCFWKLYWTLILIGAVSITSYQIYTAVDDYLTSPTMVSVYPLKDDMDMPNIEFCFHTKYVLAWVTLNNTILTNETGKYFLHLLSKMINVPYLDIYYADDGFYNSNSWNDVWSPTDKNHSPTENAKNYNDMLNNLGVTNELNYAKRFIAETPNFIIFPPTKIKSAFAGNYVCYSYALNGTIQFQMYMPMNSMHSYTLNLSSVVMNMLQWSYPDSFYVENRNILSGPLLKNLDADLNALKSTNFTSIKPQEMGLAMVNIGNLSPFTIKTNINYDIQLSATKVVSLNRPANPCNPTGGIRSVILKEMPTIKGLNCNNTCYNLCVYQKKNTSLCMPGIEPGFGLENSANLTLKLCDRTATYTGKAWQVDRGNGADEISDNANIDVNCEAQCPPPCSQWMYFASIQRTPGTLYRVWNFNVVFPVTSSVLVSQERVAYTWIDLLGNVGGLLGLWLGASLLSFIQGIYQFCCICENDNVVEDLPLNQKEWKSNKVPPHMAV